MRTAPDSLFVLFIFLPVFLYFFKRAPRGFGNGTPDNQHIGDAHRRDPDSQEHLNTFLGRNNTGREYIVQQNLNNTLAIVKGQWKYIEPSDAPAIEFWTKIELGNDQQPQLYDLSSDPSEKTNVAKQHPDIVKELAELLESVKEK